MVYVRCSLCTCIIRRVKTHAGEPGLWDIITKYCRTHILEQIEKRDPICGTCDTKFRHCLNEGQGRIPEEIEIVSSLRPRTNRKLRRGFGRVRAERSVSKTRYNDDFLKNLKLKLKSLCSAPNSIKIKYFLIPVAFSNFSR